MRGLAAVGAFTALAAIGAPPLPALQAALRGALALQESGAWSWASTPVLPSARDNGAEEAGCSCPENGEEPSFLLAGVAIGFALLPAIDVLHLPKLVWQRGVLRVETALRVPPRT